MPIGSGGGLVLDGPNDSGQERATGATTDQLGDNGAGVEISGYQARKHQRNDLPEHPAAMIGKRLYGGRPPEPLPRAGPYLISHHNAKVEPTNKY